MRNFKYLILLIIVFGIVTPLSLKAADQTQSQPTIVKAKVLDVLTTSTELLPGSNKSTPTQSLEVQILEGADSGQTVVFDNDYVMLNQGEVFYLSIDTSNGGVPNYSVFEPDRVPVLLFFAILFVVLVLIFGGLQGLRGLLSLAGSMLVIIFILLPLILRGFSPLLVSIVVSSLIIILGSYITHGFNKTTSSAVISMIITVIVTGVMAYFAVHWSQFTGITSDESIYLNLDTANNINLVGLLMGGIMIGLLGVLYDVSIGQSIAVEELHNVATHLSRWKIYKRAIRIGREHIGALVNTLAIAYVGASLSLLLLAYSGADASFSVLINREVFATEIIRILVGSIGLVLAVPITTLLSVIMLMPKGKQVLDKEQLQKEEKDLKHFHHTH